MKFIIIASASLLLIEASCFIIPDQAQQIDKMNSFKNLGRVKRGCCECFLSITHQSDQKNLLVCGPNGCGCNLRSTQETEVLRAKRSVSDENLSLGDKSYVSKRLKQGCRTSIAKN